MKQAPLYVHAHDLAVWVHERARAAPTDVHQTGLPKACTQEARALLAAIGLALSFPLERSDALRDADGSVSALRLWFRLGVATGWLNEGGQRHAIDAVDEIGRMVGGWRRSLKAAASTPDV